MKRDTDRWHSLSASLFSAVSDWPFDEREPTMVGPVLARLVDQARGALPSLAVPEDEFITYLALRLAEDSDKTCERLGELPGDDLYLACACSMKISGAAEAFNARYRSHIRAILGRLRLTASQCDEAMQEILELLLTSPPEQTPRISGYTGQAPLLAYIRVVTTRAGLSLLRRHGRNSADDDDGLLDIADDVGTPEILHLKKLYREHFKDAFAEAVDTLSSKERALLRYQLVDGLTVDHIAAIYAIHRATAARWVAKARESLRRATEKAFRKRAKLTTTQADSIMRLVMTQLDVSAERLLAATSIGNEKDD